MNPNALVEFAVAMRDVQRPAEAGQELGDEDRFDVSSLGLKIALDADETLNSETGPETERGLIQAIAGSLVDRLRQRNLLRSDRNIDLFAEHAARVFVTELRPIAGQLRASPRSRRAAMSAYGFTFRR